MTSLAGVTLPEPKEFEIEDDWEGERTTSHDGTVLIDYTNLSRSKWSMEWAGLTQTNRDTLRTRYEVAASQTFIPPNTAASYAVLVVRGSWKEKPQKFGSKPPIYDVEFEVEEQS